MEYFIVRVEHETRKRGISVRKMLIDIGFNHSFLSDLKSKGTIPSVDKVLKIAQYLDVSVDYLLGRTDKPEVNK